MTASSSCPAPSAPTSVGTQPAVARNHKPFKTVALVGKFQAAGISQTLLDLADCIVRRGYQVVFEQETAQNVGITQFPTLASDELAKSADVAVVLGGDGTMLGIARQLAGKAIPLIGINLGRLGFMTDIALGEMQAVLPAMLAGQYERESRTLLEARVLRNGEIVFEGVAFNDVVVNRSGISGMVELGVSVDGFFMYNQRSDGLIVSTPTGSTAYALAAGGPILHPTLSGMVLVPIAAHSLSNRPIVLPQQAEVVIEIAGGRDVVVSFDMQSLTEMLPGDQIVVRRASQTVTFLHPIGYNYYATLRKKLHWHEYPSEDNKQL